MISNIPCTPRIRRIAPCSKDRIYARLNATQRYSFILPRPAYNPAHLTQTWRKRADGGDSIVRYSPSLLLHTPPTSKRSLLNQGVFLFALVLTLSPALAAQQATIVGTVTDQTGALMSAVTVTVANTQTGARRTESTNNVGQYVVFGLPTSERSASKPSFRPKPYMSLNRPTTFPRMRKSARRGSTTMGFMVGCSGLSTTMPPSVANRFTVAS